MNVWDSLIPRLFFCKAKKDHLCEYQNFFCRLIQRSIAEPCLPLEPCLPWFLLVSIKLQQHAESIKPFLDSLPPPFHWRIETKQEAEGLHEGIHTLNQEGVRNSMAFAEKSKAAGNKAFAQKERKAAVDAYTDTIDHLVDALAQKPDAADEEKAKRLMAVSYANRAAAYLLPGDGVDLDKALADGRRWTPLIVKRMRAFFLKIQAKILKHISNRYIRQATSSQMLGKTDDALDAITRALRRKDLENDASLVDRLIGLLTEGKGFSDDEGVFKNWMLDVLINDQKTAANLKGVNGEWKKRCNAQFAKWK
jgi:tetratricopeptide (TPR) repeat protein